MKEITDVKSIEIFNPDCDYYGFPENIFTFGYSKKNSKPILLDMGNAKWYLRKEKTQAILIYWDGEVSDRIFNDSLSKLREIGIKRFGSLLSFVKPPIPSVKGKVWMSYDDWKNNDIKSRTKHHIRNYMKRFKFDILEYDSTGVDIALEILDKWYEKAKERHFMVVYGHYYTILSRYPNLDRALLLKMTPKNSDTPCGLIGGFIDNYHERAVVTIAKHDYTQKGACDALWGKWIQYVHDELNIHTCNCGDTGDILKSKFGLTPKVAFRISRRDIKRKNTKLIEI